MSLDDLANTAEPTTQEIVAISTELVRYWTINISFEKNGDYFLPVDGYRADFGEFGIFYIGKRHTAQKFSVTCPLTGCSLPCADGDSPEEAAFEGMKCLRKYGHVLGATRRKQLGKFGYPTQDASEFALDYRLPVRSVLAAGKVAK